MNMYRVLGDRIGTLEARALAQQLVRWHDAMVKHLRTIPQQSRRCTEGCPHDDARSLWAEALEVFGDEAGTLTFLQQYGASRRLTTGTAAVPMHV
jgi:hypothetical protein